MIIDDEMFTKLSKFDRALTTAYKSGYARIGNLDMKEIFLIYYGPDWESKVSRSVFSCGNCKLNELKKIGKDYVEYGSE